MLDNFIMKNKFGKGRELKFVRREKLNYLTTLKIYNQDLKFTGIFWKTVHNRT
jgi:hypothetical protein